MIVTRSETGTARSLASPVAGTSSSTGREGTGAAAAATLGSSTAAAGLSVGNGRAAYETAFGQLAVLVAVAMVAACWFWAGRMLRLPEEERVFPR